MSNEIMNVNENENMIADLTAAQSSFCSLKANTPEEKAKLFAAMNNPEKRLSDCVNTTIMAKDLFCEIVDCKNEDTGEITKCPRIVVIDDKGIGYQAVSLGVFSAFKKLMGVFGTPTWEPPLPLAVKQVGKGNKRLLTFTVDFKK
mgnify:CR=1 FL=1